MMTTQQLITSDEARGRDAVAKFQAAYNRMALSPAAAQSLSESGEFWREVHFLMAKFAGSSFSFQSDPGDFIGQGASKGYSARNTSFEARTSPDKNAVKIYLKREYDDWGLEFAAKPGQRLKEGVYHNAVRYPFNNGTSSPAMSMYGCGRAANRSMSEFTIHRIRFGKEGELILLSAEFVHCDVGFHEQSTHGTLPVVRGQVFFNEKNKKPR